MRTPVIAGLDPLRPDPAPVVLGAALARLTGAPLVVAAVHLHDAITDAVSGGRVEDDLRRTAQAELERATIGLGAELVVVPGRSAAHALHELAAQRGAGLLVVGSSQRGRLGRLAPGATAERLLHGAACPVAVAPAGLADDWAPRRVGVGYVALEEGEHALTAASALARLAGGSLEAVTAVIPRVWDTSAAIPAYGVDGGVEAARDRAGTALQRTLARAGRPADEGQVFIGEPVDALVALSERVDLVVCGSRGYGPVRSVLLGGVGHGLLRDARCPVLVVPRGGGRAVAALTEEREAAPA
jgi:nucleotide-binding universal stress UspA family protein